MYEDTAQFQLHRRIARELESNVKNRDWWLWMDFHLDEETDVSIAGLADAVEQWLSQMDPDDQAGERVPAIEWTGGGIHVEITAARRGVASRGSAELIGNPFPVFAVWTSS